MNFVWFGDRITQYVNDRIDRSMHAMGEAVVARAQALAPVKTGALRNSIYYVVEYNEGGGRHVLHINVGMSYGIFQEFGTRNMMPHPFIRPAMAEVGRAWGFDLAMDFASPGTTGLLASTGRGRKPGYSAAVGSRPFTARQASHVERHLIPGVKKWHRGNVKRARFHVQ